MRKWFIGLALGLACLCGAVGVSSARAIAIAVPRPGPDRLTGADVVLLGRVVGFEPQDVEATPAKNIPQKVIYRIAIVQVTEAIRGLKKGEKQIRVAFPAPQVNAPGAGVPMIQPLPVRRPGFRPGFGGTMQLQMGQEGLFMIAKHHEGKFFLSPNYGQFVQRQNNANFDNEVKTVRKLATFLDNPKAALKAKDAEDRFLAATMLVSQYRTARAFPIEQVPIDAEESKLILLALADGNWNMNRPMGGMTPNPFQVFYQLGVTPQDGWKQPNARNQQEIADAMKTWLKENASKFRIKKMVQGEGGKGQVAPQPGVIPGRPIRIQPVPGGPIRIQPLPVQIQPLPAPAPQVDPAAPQPVRPIRGGVRIQVLPAVQPLPALPVAPQRRPQPIDN